MLELLTHSPTAAATAKGHTALHMASACEEEFAEEIGSILVKESMAVLGAKTHGDGITPLQIAVLHNNLVMVQLLLDVGGPRAIGLNDATVAGDTALHLAADAGKEGLCKILVEVRKPCIIVCNA